MRLCILLIAAFALLSGLAPGSGSGEERITVRNEPRPRLEAGMLELGGGILVNFGRTSYGNTVVGTAEIDHILVEPILGYFVTPGLELTGGLGFGRMDHDSVRYSETALTFDVGATFNYDTRTWFVPYTFAKFGFGSFSWTFEDTVSYSETLNGALARFGGGARMFVGNHWNIKAEYRVEKVFEEKMVLTSTVMLYLSGLIRR